MVEAQFSIFDSIVLVVVGLSALIAFFRGFVKEVLSLGAWIGAAIITIYAFPHVTEYLKPHFSSPIVATGIGTLGTYIAALLGISIINSIIIRYMKTGAEVGMIDNFLGLLFGAARGVFVVSLGFLLAKPLLIGNQGTPDWLAESKTLPAVEYGADLLLKAAPKYLAELEKIGDDAKEGAQDAAKSIDYMQNGMEDKLDDLQGYSKDQRRNLDRVIDSTRRTP